MRHEVRESSSFRCMDRARTRSDAGSLLSLSGGLLSKGSRGFIFIASMCFTWCIVAHLGAWGPCSSIICTDMSGMFMMCRELLVVAMQVTTPGKACCNRVHNKVKAAVTSPSFSPSLASLGSRRRPGITGSRCAKSFRVRNDPLHGMVCDNTKTSCNGLGGDEGAKAPENGLGDGSSFKGMAGHTSPTTPFKRWSLQFTTRAVSLVALPLPPMRPRCNKKKVQEEPAGWFEVRLCIQLNKVGLRFASQVLPELEPLTSLFVPIRICTRRFCT